MRKLFQANAQNRWITLICLMYIVFSLANFTYRAFIGNGIEVDLYHFYYAGYMWNEGLNPYDFELFKSYHVGAIAAHSYPPHANILFSVLARLPIDIMPVAVFAFNLTLLVMCMFMLAHIIRWFKPIGLFEVTLLIGLVNTRFARGKVSLFDTQLGVLMASLVLFMFIMQVYNRRRWAGIALGLVSFKPTIFILYPLQVALRKQYRILIYAAGISVGLMLGALVFTQRPVISTMLEWASQVGTFTAGTYNDPSPFYPNSAVLMNLEPLVYRILNNDGGIAKIVQWTLVIALSAYTLYLTSRTTKPTRRDYLMDFALISQATLLFSYHRIYDIFLLFPALIYLFIHTYQLDEQRQRLFWIAFIVALLVIITMPGDISPRIASRFPVLLDSYLWRVIAPFHAWANLIVMAVLIRLKRRQVALEQSTLRHVESGLSPQTVAEG